MKTPHAVLIGLSLITPAIYFKNPVVKPAEVPSFGGAVLRKAAIVFNVMCTNLCCLTGTLSFVSGNNSIASR